MTRKVIAVTVALLMLAGCKGKDLAGGDEVSARVRLDPTDRCRVIISQEGSVPGAARFAPLAAKIEGCQP